MVESMGRSSLVGNTTRRPQWWLLGTVGCASLSTYFGIFRTYPGGGGRGIPGGGARGNPVVVGEGEIPILGQNCDSVDSINGGKVLDRWLKNREKENECRFSEGTQVLRMSTTKGLPVKRPYIP